MWPISLFWTCIHSVSHFCSSLPPSCQTQGSCILPPAWEIQPEFPSGFCFWQKNTSLQNPKRERHQKITKTYQHRSLPVSPLGQSLSALKHSSAYFLAIKALGGEICVSSLCYTGCLGVAELFCLAANESSHRRQFSALAMSVQPDPKRTSLPCPEKSLRRGAGCSSRAACTLLLQAARGCGGLLHVCCASREHSVSNSMPLSI